MVFTASFNDIIVGEYVLLGTRPNIMEIINIAVREEYQGKRIGKLVSGYDQAENGTGIKRIFILGKELYT